MCKSHIQYKFILKFAELHQLHAWILPFVIFLLDAKFSMIWTGKQSCDNETAQKQPQMFFKRGVLKNFAIFTGKTSMLESRFNKVAGLKVCSFIKKRLQHCCFPLNVRKLSGTAFFIEDLRWLLLTASLEISNWNKCVSIYLRVLCPAEGLITYSYNLTCFR